jgi:peroxiredoxin
LVQLQTDRKDIEAAGIQIVAVSYDDQKTLAAFADAKGIQFPLLSDPGSTTIEAYGVLNKEATGLAKGVPYPGTFVIDKDGVVRAKLFKDGYKERHTTAELIDAAKTVK